MNHTITCTQSERELKRERQKRTELLRQSVQDWAEESARSDLKFCGDEPWKGVTLAQRQELEKALIHYARTGAARTFDTLKLRGNLASTH